MLAGLESPSQEEPGSGLARAVPPNRPHGSARGTQAAPFCPKPNLHPCLGAQDPDGEDVPFLTREDSEPSAGGEWRCLSDPTSTEASTPPLSRQEAGQLLGPAWHSPVHQGDEKGEELTVEARRHAL